MRVLLRARLPRAWVVFMNEMSAIQAGGVLAFTGVMIWLYRKIEPALIAMRDSIVGKMDELRDEGVEMRIIFTAWLERERIRDERRKRESSTPPRRTPGRGVPTDFDQEETTNIEAITERIRNEVTATRPGLRIPRKGTHHDGER